MPRTLALFGASLLFCAALGEVGLRAAGFAPPAIGAAPATASRDAFQWAEPDPVVGWLNRPGVQHWPSPDAAPMTFLADHRRASFAGDTKPARARVVLIGCSYSAGLGIADADTFAWRLNAALPDARIENHATSGWSTWQALRRTAQILVEAREPPALVVYAYMGNHDQRNVARYEWLEGLQAARPGTHLVPPHVTLESDRLVEHPMQVLEPWPLEGRSASIALAHDLALRIAYWRSPEMRREVTRRLLVRFDEQVRAAGSRFLVALLADVDPEAGLDHFLSDHGIAHVDCQLPDWRDDASLHLPHDIHPSALAHARWAACLRDPVARSLAVE